MSHNCWMKKGNLREAGRLFLPARGVGHPLRRIAPAWLFLGLLLGYGGCRSNGEAAPGAHSEDLAAQRAGMVQQQIAARGVTDAQVLDAMRSVPRHAFVPERWRDRAYSDTPLPIGYEQTISQPYIVALMTELADLEPGDKVLEIGTGSGYQAAVLAEIVGEVYSIEILEPLARQAEATLRRLGYDNVHVRHGDGYAGWPSEAPFDAILVTAAPPAIPELLVEQLAPGGRMVVPVGEGSQDLQVLVQTDGRLERRSVLPVRFVPMTGAARGE